jgi:hypothetical protein
MSEPRYFTAEFPDGISQDDFRSLLHGGKMEVMRAWFHERYEDPANQTPHDNEDGYIYAWGGPYDAREELEMEFGSLDAGAEIDQLVRELERQCLEWAPTDAYQEKPDEDRIVEGAADEHDELDQFAEQIARGVSPRFGTSDEQRHRAEILARLDELERELERLRRPRGMIGHNRPPEPIDSLPLGEGDRGALAEELADLRVQLVAPEPDVRISVRVARKLRRVLTSLAKWTGKKFDSGIDAFVKAIFGAAGAPSARRDRSSPA